MPLLPTTIQPHDTNYQKNKTAMESHIRTLTEKLAIIA